MQTGSIQIEPQVLVEDDPVKPRIGGWPYFAGCKSEEGLQRKLEGFIGVRPSGL